MAVGARQSDIRQQFLIEAVLVCLLGGVLGIGLALLLGSMIGRFASDFQVLFSTASIVAAFACSTPDRRGVRLPARAQCRAARPGRGPGTRMKMMTRLPFPPSRRLLAGAVLLALSGCASVGRYPVADPDVAAQYGRGDATLNAPADDPRSSLTHRATTSARTPGGPASATSA